MTGNAWCRALGITPPKLEAVAHHREANTFSLLLVALLECGEPMTLLEVAERFEAAGVAERGRALLSLQRCKPGRPPVYREGDLYHLDPHDADLDLWAFRLDLRPPKRPPVRHEAPPADSDVRLTVGELDEAFRDASLSSWSAQRLALAVLDACGGPQPPAAVVAEVAARTRWHLFRGESAGFQRRGSAVVVLPDGRWAMADDATEALRQARVAVRERVAMARRHATMRPDPAETAARIAESERERAARGAELARMSRALLVVFPKSRPRAAALLDVGEHTIATFVGDELAELRRRLNLYEVLGAIDIRAVLRALDVDAGEQHRLAELGPPQKTMKINARGRTLTITSALLAQGSCGLSRPFGDEAKLAEYLDKGEVTKLRRRLEADVKSLYALYEYGRLHGAVRLRWGFLNEFLPAPWAHRDETKLDHLMNMAHAQKVPLEVIVGSAPGWEEPWSRSRLAYVEKEANGWQSWLVDESGYVIDAAEVQRARLVGP